MSLTTDPNTPCLNDIQANGQQKCYLVLSDDERAKGFVRPVRTEYQHVTCGGRTSMGKAIAETYARDPKFYGGTYCATCGTHFDLIKVTENTVDGKQYETRQFLWIVDGKSDGSFVGE